MNYDYRTHRAVILLSDKIEAATALNVTAHLSVALGAYVDKDTLMGRRVIEDSSGIGHTGIARYPIILKRAKPLHVREAISQARLAPELFLADYPAQMLSTGHDDELAAELKKSDEAALEYMGALIFGPTATVDAICRRHSLWK